MILNGTSFPVGLKLFVLFGSFLIVWLLQYLVLDVDEYSAKSLVYSGESSIQFRSHYSLSTVEHRRNEVSNAIHEYVTKTSIELNDDKKDLHFTTINSFDYYVESLFLDRYGSDDQNDSIVTGYFVHKLRRKTLCVFQDTVVVKLRCEILPRSTICVASTNKQSQIFVFLYVSLLMIFLFSCYEHFPQRWADYIVSFSDILDDNLLQTTVSTERPLIESVCDTDYKCSRNSVHDEESTSLLSID